jgi:hypothetical protein
MPKVELGTCFGVVAGEELNIENKNLPVGVCFLRLGLVVGKTSRWTEQLGTRCSAAFTPTNPGLTTGKRPALVAPAHQRLAARRKHQATMAS